VPPVQKLAQVAPVQKSAQVAPVQIWGAVGLCFAMAAAALTGWRCFKRLPAPYPIIYT